MEECFCVEHQLSHTEVPCFVVFVNRNLILGPVIGLNCSIRTKNICPVAGKSNSLVKTVTVEQREGGGRQSLKTPPHTHFSATLANKRKVTEQCYFYLLAFYFCFPFNYSFGGNRTNWYAKKDIFVS